MVLSITPSLSLGALALTTAARPASVLRESLAEVRVCQGPAPRLWPQPTLAWRGTRDEDPVSWALSGFRSWTGAMRKQIFLALRCLGKGWPCQVGRGLGRGLWCCFQPRLCGVRGLLASPGKTWASWEHRQGRWNEVPAWAGWPGGWVTGQGRRGLWKNR